MQCEFAADDQVLIYSMPCVCVCMSKRQRIKRIKSWSRSLMHGLFNRICVIYRKNYRNTGRWLRLRLLMPPHTHTFRPSHGEFRVYNEFTKIPNRKEQYIRMARHRHSVVGNLWCDRAHVDHAIPHVMLTSSLLLSYNSVAYAANNRRQSFARTICSIINRFVS